MDSRAARSRRLLPIMLALAIAGAATPSLGAVGPLAPPGGAVALASGVGRFRFAAIGLDQPVYDYGCRGGTLPNLVELWGCAGANNAYLLGHAWGVFQPLHDAYAIGRLRVGQSASLTVAGATRPYRVAWIRIVPATYVWRGLSGDAWAWNATDGPAVTLQTCWGSGSQYRLIVRLTS